METGDTNGVIYGLDDRPPPVRAFVLAVQHVLTMFGATVAVPLLLGPSMGMDTDDVAVLIRTGDLEGAVHGAPQVQEVVGLEKHVGKLGVGDPLLAVLKPVTNRILLDHRVDREVLANITEDFEVTQLAQPIDIVDHDRDIGCA